MTWVFRGGQLLMVGGSAVVNENCCCDNPCPCCYHSVKILRDAGGSFTTRLVLPGPCDPGEVEDAEVSAFICGDETFVTDPGTEEGCTCYRVLDYDFDRYSTDPCDQQFYMPYSTDDVCNYNPPGPGVGTETHIGTLSFREVVTVRLCYDPCGTVTLTINHKVYCNFGVWIHDEPPPADPVTDTWVDVSTDLVLDATYEWTDIEAPNCVTDFDIGPPTSYTEASDYTKTWGTPFINSTYCTSPSSSSFTVVIPGSCEATGLKLIGGGTPCECGTTSTYFVDGYQPSGYFADGYQP